MRFTLTDMARCLEEQTGLFKESDWYPLSCVTPFPRFISALTGDTAPNTTCHPHCSLGTLVYVDERDGSCIPITRFVDTEGLLTEMNRQAEIIEGSKLKFFKKTKAFLALKKYFKGDSAPKGFSFDEFIFSLDGLMDKEIGRSESTERNPIKLIFVAGMHFMDAYNYEVERVKRCVIHYATPDGLLYPFCTYNSGPCFREQVERSHSIPWNRGGGRS